MKVSSAGKRGMRMLDNVRDAVIAALQSAGLPADRAYPHSPVPADGCMIRVGVSRTEDCSSGFAGYLGMQRGPEYGEREVYGLRCALALSLDIYAPLSMDDGAGACLKLFDGALPCVEGCGIRLKRMHCGEPAPDRASGMMHLRGEAEGTALLVSAADSGNEATFSDFVLRGELNV